MITTPPDTTVVRNPDASTARRLAASPVTDIAIVAYIAVIGGFALLAIWYVLKLLSGLQNMDTTAVTIAVALIIGGLAVAGIVEYAERRWPFDELQIGPGNAGMKPIDLDARGEYATASTESWSLIESMAGSHQRLATHAGADVTTRAARLLWQSARRHLDIVTAENAAAQVVGQLPVANELRAGHLARAEQLLDETVKTSLELDQLERTANATTTQTPARPIGPTIMPSTPPLQ